LLAAGSQAQVRAPSFENECELRELILPLVLKMSASCASSFYFAAEQQNLFFRVSGKNFFYFPPPKLTEYLGGG
jgi:hypothetical protein